jgi:cold shock protein
MQTGHVKWFNARKGYGVISPDEGGFNVLVRISAVELAGLLELRAGQKINFETVAAEHTGEIFAVNLSALANAPAVSKLSVSEPSRKWGGALWILTGRKSL